jgi:6-phosphogluconolactonase
MTKRSEEPEKGGRPEPFEVEALPPAPPLPGEVIVRATADEAIDALAADLVVEAVHGLRQFGGFHLALSGGSTPQPLYERLMYDPNYRRLPWKATHLWQVDERCVEPDDPASNFRMIRETIVEHADIPAAQVHPIPAMNPHADLDYEKEIRETLCWRDKGQERLDFVLLGVGADGHTASLFPHTEVLHETQRLVRLSEAPNATPRKRVTMTLPLINAARVVVVLALGKGKSPIIARLARGHDPVEELPIKGVRPERGVLRWYLDAEAAQIDKE